MEAGPPAMQLKSHNTQPLDKSQLVNDMKFLPKVMICAFLLAAINQANASSFEENVVKLSCPNLMNGTLHLNHTWDDGYLTADGVGTLALQSYEQIDNEGAILTFSNGNVRAKILPKVQDNVIQFFLWDKGNWHPCSYK